IHVMEPAPEDPFTAPWRSLGSLRRFNWQNELNQRVRVSGIVTMQAPGRYLYVQDGADSVFALSQQKDLLRPGDHVEVVGFPGNEGRRFLMREAVYRRVSGGNEPQATRVTAGTTVDIDREGLLAAAEGTLINAARREGEARLLIQSKDSTFEASLDLA